MSKKILIIDDDKDIAEMIKAILSKEDYEVDYVYDGLKAIEKVNKEEFNLILLDILMPLFSGYWFCYALKQKDRTKNIPIIVISILSDKKDIDKAYDVGADAYLRKPFRAEELTKLVNTLMSKNNKNNKNNKGIKE